MLDRGVQIGVMRPPMETLQDLMEKAKVRLLWWAICVFGISYFLSHTSKSMLTNVPIAVIILCALRYLSYEVELHWKVQPIHRQSYLSHLQKKQISKNDPLLTTLPPTPKWKRQIASPLVESAIHSFIDKILQDFVVDLWYSSITPDKEAPQLIRVLVLDVIGEIAGRINEINLVDLLTSDMVDMINSHLDLYRRNQSIIGVEVMGTLSCEERDGRLKHHLMASGELHPALISPECEYKVLQRLVTGILASVLEPKEAQCPLVRCLGRELLTCLVLQPVMNLASPAYINKLIEFLFLASKDDKNKETDRGNANTNTHGHSSHILHTQSTASDMNKSRVPTQSSDLVLNRTAGEISVSIQSDVACEHPEKPLPSKSADWAKLLEAATERRTQVLAPDNLENMWTKGRNYRKKAAKLTKSAVPPTGNLNMNSGIVDNYVHAGSGKEMSSNLYHKTTTMNDKYQFPSTGLHSSTHKTQNELVNVSRELGRTRPVEGTHSVHGQGNQGSQLKERSKYHVTRSSSTSDLKRELNIDAAFPEKVREITNVKEPYLRSFAQEKDDLSLSRASQPVFLSEGSSHTPKLKCRVLGAYFEKSGSNSFAVYSISVTDAENMTRFVKRRYRNFERLHRQLKDIPNYTLHLPPKRFLSSSLDDSFVLHRCILLDKYLQDLLSIANIAEQLEVWDFFSASSKNYSFGKSTSVMKTLAVNVDDAMDDIVRQFKGVSDGLRRKVVEPSLSSHAAYLPNTDQSTSLSYAEGTTNKSLSSLSHNNMEIANSFSDDDIRDEKSSSALITGWHSDNELNLKGFPSRMVRKNGIPRSLGSQSGELSDKFESSDLHQYLPSSTLATSSLSEQQNGIPPEWSPPNVSIPLLNLVDNIFQLKRRGWLRRQVFWISKQILQLIMEDAIDDWLLRQIYCLRKDDVVAQGIRWVQDVLWPGGTFFTKLEANQMKENDADDDQKMARNSSRRFIDKAPVSFEQQLEAARRASDVKKIVLDGAPTALISLIGRKQYRRCAKDIYYFLQSDICIKQLAYAMLELLLISIFPELHDLVLDIHHGDHYQPS